MWTVYGTNVDPATATDEDWVVVDDVFEGSLEDVDFTPYGYTIDEDKQGEYQYYKFYFTYGVAYHLGAFQLCEIYLYIEA